MSGRRLFLVLSHGNGNNDGNDDEDDNQDGEADPSFLTGCTRGVDGFFGVTKTSFRILLYCGCGCFNRVDLLVLLFYKDTHL